MRELPYDQAVDVAFKRFDRNDDGVITVGSETDFTEEKKVHGTRFTTRIETPELEKIAKIDGDNATVTRQEMNLYLRTFDTPVWWKQSGGGDGRLDARELAPLADEMRSKVTWSFRGPFGSSSPSTRDEPLLHDAIKGAIEQQAAIEAWRDRPRGILGWLLG